MRNETMTIAGYRPSITGGRGASRHVVVSPRRWVFALVVMARRQRANLFAVIAGFNGLSRRDAQTQPVPKLVPHTPPFLTA